MSYWFAGLMRGLEDIDAPARTTLLRACGQACARSYTAQVFRESWERAGGDLARFLAELATRFPASIYTLVSDDTVQVRYDACACDLVQSGWVTSPVLCECSAHNLQANFAAALGTPVVVTLKTSLLRGGEACLFEVRLTKTTKVSARTAPCKLGV
ncbi:MAG: hypothetical protein ACP5J4_21070 [Anaerolineae bacterium]